ncbi:MAG: aldehyde dehydrogenase EutE [Oligoflexia bacterium]|nr:aldehyde dehydrogenase EutE [Oligoflexia bacterium]
MKITESQLEGLVNKVVSEIRSRQASPPAQAVAAVAAVPVVPAVSSTSTSTSTMGCFETIDQAIAAGKRAFQEFREVPLEQRKRIITAIRKFARAEVKELARIAHEETGLGRYEDKIQKNLLAIDKTPGVEDIAPEVFSGDHGLTLVEFAPYGVIGSITPCTNPSETIINNGIGMIAGGNVVVFNPHPSAKKVSAFTVSLLNRAVLSEGGPLNLFSTVINPTIESAQRLMTHPEVQLLAVTGGPAVVKVAMKSGKRVIAAGPGNPPTVVDESADFEQAAADIVTSASMDNNIICVLEKEIIVTEKAYAAFKKALVSAGAYELSGFHTGRLVRLLVDEHGYPNKDFVGKDVGVILSEVGLDHAVGPKLRLAFADVGPDHPFATTELLMPIIPLIKVSNIDQAIELACNLEGGRGHTATMHSRNLQNLHKMAVKINTAIFVKNGPALAGIGFKGEGVTSFTIASPTGEGVTTARHFVRSRRCVLGSGYFRIV